MQWREEVLSRAEHQSVARLTYDLKVAKVRKTIEVTKHNIELTHSVVFLQENFSQQRHNRIEFETQDNFYKNIVNLVKTELLLKRDKTDSLVQETTQDQKAQTELGEPIHRLQELIF